AEKRVREINQAIRRIRAGDITNEELVDLYVARSQDFQGVGLRDERYTGGHADLGLPNDYIRDVKAPARVRNRAIAILQELREAQLRGAGSRLARGGPGRGTGRRSGAPCAGRTAPSSPGRIWRPSRRQRACRSLTGG